MKVMMDGSADASKRHEGNEGAFKESANIEKKEEKAEPTKGWLVYELFDGPNVTLIEALEAICNTYNVEIVIGEKKDGTNFSFNVRDRHEQG